MYLAIDIGGTKTLITIFDKLGNKIVEKKIQTDHDYANFLRNLEISVAEIATEKLTACCSAIPGLMDRDSGNVVALGNLPWKNKPMKSDISKALSGLPIIIENDSRLAALAEAKNLSDKYRDVLYLTISTGIGGGLIRDGKIVDGLEDTEMGKMPLPYENSLQPWERFASGKAIFNRYGTKASEITDKKIWSDIGERIAYGTAICCSVLQPNAIVFGGGVGQYADKFTPTIVEYLKTHLDPVVRQPIELLPAHFPDDSVVRGCYILLRQKGLA